MYTGWMDGRLKGLHILITRSLTLLNHHWDAFSEGLLLSHIRDLWYEQSVKLREEKVKEFARHLCCSI